MLKKLLVTTVALLSMGYAIVPAAMAKSFPQPRSSVQDLNHVIATVNGEPITKHQFQQFYERSVKRLRQQHQLLPDIGEMHRYLLNQLIERRLQLQMAERAEIKVTAKQVRQQIQSIMKQQHMTLAELKQYVHGLGYTFDQFRKEVHDEILIGQLQRQALSSRVTVSKEEVTSAYNKIKNDPQFASQYHVVDLLIPLKDNATAAEVAAAKQKALSIKADLLKGGSYKYIDAKDATNLGWRTIDQLPDLFAKPVTALKVNGVTGPLRAANGFHIIQLLNKKPSKQVAPTLEQVQQHVFMKKLQTQMSKWLKELRKQSDIQIYDTSS